MTDSQNKQIQEVEALLAERRKYEQWIAQLEGRKADTPAHVYTKVHGDYTARLNEAQAKLSAESGVVQKLVSELSASLATHERQITEKQDERSEAELRAAVGEFSEKEWDKLRSKLDGAIANITTERDTIRREHDTLRALLNEATATPATPVRPIESVRKPEPPLPPIVESKTAPAAAPAAAAAGEKKADVDELAFLRSVLGRSTPYTNSAGQPAVTAPAVDALLRDSANRGAAGSASGAATRTATPESFAAATPVADPHTFSAPPKVEISAPRKAAAVSTPRDSEVIKTLKCQECGTMNFPTEWYCERCGGELAAF